jgi:hypothetical protein
MTYYKVKWEVDFHKDFDLEFEALPDDVQSELLAHACCWSSLARSSAVCNAG